MGGASVVLSGEVCGAVRITRVRPPSSDSMKSMPGGSNGMTFAVAALRSRSNSMAVRLFVRSVM
ncbi:hypothetical protein [Streptomyces alboflavus]|uniref:hypothetical protein n=1 Tax=Streptomyces alboflavus TaxID=67267 RepID=UPI0004C2A96C|nr:hypothetical protein [Streptomyces alboflavus]